MKNIEIKALVTGDLTENCYLAKNRTTYELFVIDPGDEADRIISEITAMEGKPVVILLTHGHYDHIGAARAIKESYDIPVYALDREKEVLTDAKKNLTLLFTGSGYTLEADFYLKDKEKINIAGFDIEVIYTPGHTIGSASYYLPAEGLVFSGDALFCGSVGRTDFPTGDMDALHNSVHERLFALPDETLVLPGHDNATTIGYEKKYNPY